MAELTATTDVVVDPFRGTAGRRPVSIICVFNDAEVRRRCLDRSIADLRHETPRVEYVPVDNVSGRFASAGAALNHGASRATRDYVVFVHQDVYLHSLRALEEAAGVLAEGDFGVLGAVGARSDGRLVGQIRDRVVLLGDRLSEPTDVDSLDEVLFMVPRDLLRREPLTEAPEMAWHAYAIEYGLRARSLGLRVGAIDIPLTHNSLTTNLDRLDLAHRAVADRYPGTLPVHTTCGTVAARGSRPPRDPRILRSQRWRYRWLKESVEARKLRRAVGGGRCVLGDIRLDIDDVVGLTPDSPMLVFNLDERRSFVQHRDAVELVQHNRTIMVRSGGIPELTAAVGELQPGASALLTNLDSATLRWLAPLLPRDHRLIGWYTPIGCWALLGPAAAAVPPQWRSSQSRPFRVPVLTPYG